MRQQHWDPSETQEKEVGGAQDSVRNCTELCAIAGFPPPLEVSTAFTCFINSSSLEELSSELKSSMLPTSSVAKLLLHLHLQLLLEVADLVLHASTNLDVEVFSASTCRKSCRCGGLPCLHLLM